MYNLLYLLIPIVFYALNGGFDAMMDNVKDHWSESIFNNPTRFNGHFFNEYFLNPALSWKDKYKDNNVAEGHKKWVIGFIVMNVPDALTDFWHICKMMREGCNILAILSTQFAITPIPIVWWIYVIEGLILAILRNNNFSLFYNKILIKK